MNKKEIKNRLKSIKSAAWDDERARVLEGWLYKTVLVAIRDGAELPEELAALALKAEDIEFNRY